MIPPLQARPAQRVDGGTADAVVDRLAEETAARHGLRRDSRQYELAWRHFGSTGNLYLALASAEGRDLAGVMVFACGTNATYVWGASAGSPEARRFNPNQLLHWTAMRWAHAQGCRTYDFHGIPDHDEAVLEAEYSRHDEGTWNLYRFKRGFGGRVRAALDFVLERVRHEPGRVLGVLERGLAQEARDMAGLEDAEAGEKEDRQADAQHRERDEPAADGRDGGIEERSESALHGSKEATTERRRPQTGGS